MHLGIKLREFDNLDVQGCQKTYKSFTVATLLAEECTKHPVWIFVVDIFIFFPKQFPIILALTAIWKLQIKEIAAIYKFYFCWQNSNKDIKLGINTSSFFNWI